MSRLVPCTDLNRRRALQYLNRLSDTGRGLAGALEAALADPTTDTILVIADAPPTTGLQGDALTAIAQATHRNAGRARIHVFALGDFDVSELAVLTRENDGELRRGIK
jgi:acyl-CoA synthetase (NDP forming)